VIAGKAFKHFKEGIDIEKMKRFDNMHPSDFSSAFATGGGGIFRDNQMDQNIGGASQGRFDEGNVGGVEPVVIVPHTWWNPNHANAVSGKFMTKALLAIGAEENAFDTAFYRMNKRDPDNLSVWLTSYVVRSDRGYYVSFLQEAISHMIRDKAVERGRFAAAYRDVIIGPSDGGPGDGWIKAVPRPRGKGGKGGAHDPWSDRVWHQVGEALVCFTYKDEKNRTLQLRNPEVRNPEDLPLGLIPPHLHDFKGAAGVDLPDGAQREVIITFVPQDELMARNLVDDPYLAGDVFVSSAKDPLSLAQDIFAAYAGTGPEFGVYGGELTMILSTMTRRDFNSIFRSWNLPVTTDADLRLLAHWVWRKYHSPGVL